MKKVVMATILVLLLSVMFMGIVKAENFGYWPSSGNQSPYQNNMFWRQLWSKSLTRVFTKDIYAPYPNDNIKLGTVVVSIFPVYNSGSWEQDSFYLFINIFVIYDAGDYYKNTPPAQRSSDEAWWIHYVNLTLASDIPYSDSDCEFKDNAYAIRVGHWALNNSKYEFVMDGTFSGSASDAWKEKLENLINDAKEKENLNTVINGASTAFSLASTALSVAFPPVGLPLSVISTGLSLYSYFSNTNDFSKKLEDILYSYSNTHKELSLELNPVKNYNTNRYRDYSNWPVMVHMWTYASIHVDKWKESQVKFNLDFSTELSAKRPYHDLPMSAKVGFSYPIVLKNAEGQQVTSEKNLNVPKYEIFPGPTKMVVEGSTSSTIYEDRWYNVEIIIPNSYINDNNLGDPHTRLWINFGDGTIKDIPTDIDVKEKNSQTTTFEIAHQWHLPEGVNEKKYTYYAFYYQDFPESFTISYHELYDSPESYGWVMKWYPYVWVSAIGQSSIYVKKSSGGGGGGGCPFLYTYNGSVWREENNVLVWAENATRPFLNTVDSYLFEAKENNGNITIGIGEPGEDVDFVDTVKLYRVYAPPGYNVAESYLGVVYAYRDVESGIARDSRGVNVTSLIGKEDNNYWVGEKGEYIDVTLNLSSENLLVIRGIDNPAMQKIAMLGAEVKSNTPVTQSTIWMYANVSGEWVKLREIKVRHSRHTNVINLDALSWFFGDKVELRFEMGDRNGIDFIGVAHDYRLVTVEPVALEDASYGYENISARDGYYLRINPGDFVRLNFEGKGDGLYLLKVYGFYFNRAMIGRGIGIVRANETNVAEAKLQESIEPGKYYVLLPLLENYSGICSIEWYVDVIYVPYSKPVVSFEAGEYEIELYIYRYDGSVQYYSLSIS